MPAKFVLGLVQTNVSNVMTENIAFVRDHVRRARDAGAEFVHTPENTGLIGSDRHDTLAQARPEDAHPMLAAAREAARDAGVWLLLGSIHVRVPDDERIANRSFLIDPAGGVVARYDKIHMFDVKLAGGESYRESSTFRPGSEAVAVDLPWGRMGMTICYDLRFPQLYRSLAHAGCTMLAIPSSFTVPTGRAHWHALMRARAIETGCFVFAAAQVGTHKGSGRKTYGHSLAVAPWGEVLADAGGDAPGFAVCEIDLAKADEARAMVPSLTHDRDFSPPRIVGAAPARAAE